MLPLLVTDKPGHGHMREVAVGEGHIECIYSVEFVTICRPHRRNVWPLVTLVVYMGSVVI